MAFIPTWLVILFFAGVAAGLVYCLALWDTKRDCRFCQIALFTCKIALLALFEFTGIWLLYSGWTGGSEGDVAYGTLILVTVNFWYGVRCLARWLRRKKLVQQKRQFDGIAAPAAVESSQGGRKKGSDQRSEPDRQGSGNAGLDTGLGL